MQKNPPLMKGSLLENILGYSLMALVFASPLIVSDGLIYGHASAKLYLLIGLVEWVLVFQLWHNVKTRESFWIFDKVSVLVYLFFLCIVLSSFLGVDWQVSFWGTLVRGTSIILWGHLVLLYVILRKMISVPGFVQSLLMASVFGALVSVFVHVLWLAGLSGEIGSAGSTVGNSTFYAAYLIFQIGFAAWLWLSNDHKTWRVVWLGSLVVLVVTLLSVTAYAAIISVFVAASMGYGLWLWFQGHDSERRVALGLLVTLGVLSLGTVGLALTPGSFVQDVFTGISTSSRFIMWDMAREAIMDRPVFGWGLEQVSVAVLEYHDPCLGSLRCGNQVFIDRVHNVIVDVWVQLGSVGVVLYLSLLLVTAGSLLRVMKDVSRSVLDKRQALILFSVLGAYVAQNLTALDTPLSLLFFIILLALASSLAGQQVSRLKDSSIARSKVMAVLVTGFLPFSLWMFVFIPMKANHAVAVQSRSQDVEERLALLPQALEGSLQGELDRQLILAQQTANILWGTPVKELAPVQSFFDEESRQIIEVLSESIKDHPNALQATMALVYLQQARGRTFDPEAFAQAQNLLRETIQKNPHHPKPYWALASILIEKGQGDEAMALLDEVRVFAPELPASFYYHAIGAKLTQDEQSFSQSFQRAREAFPGIVPQLDQLAEAPASDMIPEWLIKFY